MSGFAENNGFSLEKTVISPILGARHAWKSMVTRVTLALGDLAPQKALPPMRMLPVVL